MCVQDNPVNMMLLSTYMKKNNWEFEMATNGLIALQAFQSRAEGFDVIFMGMSYPSNHCVVPSMLSSQNNITS